MNEATQRGGGKVVVAASALPRYEPTTKFVTLLTRAFSYASLLMQASIDSVCVHALSHLCRLPLTYRLQPGTKRGYDYNTVRIRFACHMADDIAQRHHLLYP